MNRVIRNVFPSTLFKSIGFACSIACLLLLTSTIGLQVPIAHAQTPSAIDFTEVEKLANEQKLQAALDKLLEITKVKFEKADDTAQAELLIRAAMLRIGLHGYETAVRELKAASWPKKSEGRVLIELYYAHSLMAYYQMYQWEIATREKTVSQEKVDLKAWTTGQIGNEISKSFDAIMTHSANQDALAKAPSAFYSKYVEKNTYPVGIRPTLRDAVTYLAVEHLRNTQYWSADHSANSYLVNLSEEIEAKTKRLPAADEKIHPLIVMASWLGELREFHIKAGRLEAAMESRYALYEVFHGVQTEKFERDLILGRLKIFQQRNQNLAWWSRGQALHADFILQSGNSGARVEARSVARAGMQKHPDSYGGRACLAIVHEIERPDYSITAMGYDHQAGAEGKQSVTVRYRNLNRLHFRAYKLDLEEVLKQKFRGGDPILSFESIDSFLLKPENRSTEWNVQLAPTPDFSTHRKQVVPKLPALGSYIIEASSRADFVPSNNSIVRFRHTNSNVVLFIVNRPKNTLETRLLFGDSGQAVSRGDVSLYRFKWDRKPELVETKKTDKQGYVTFAKPILQLNLRNEYWNYFLYAKKDSHEAFLVDGVHFGDHNVAAQRSMSLIYTDRSIFRPEQKVFFKVVGYSGDPLKDGYKTAREGEAISVQLRDPNYQVVSSLILKTNKFGTTSGEFTIPKGRPLGNWFVETTGSYPGRVGIRVEEYKRPTFETTITDAATPLRLNKPATIKGESKYYFGLPVSSGVVKWRVVRSPRAPRWWSYYGWSWWFPQSPAQTVASGEAAMRADGTFEIKFTPAADERLASDPKQAKDINYNFAIEANVTDEGGETRTGSKSFLVGFQNLEASINIEKGFLHENEKFEATINVLNLGGKPKVVEGSYTLHRLSQPAKTPLPAELPRDPRIFRDGDPLADPKLGKHQDDNVRSRWETQANWESVAVDWPNGPVVKSGSIKTDAAGNSKLSVADLAQSGVYRITYDTKDDFGTPVSASRLFIVAQQSDPKLRLPLIFVADRSSYEVGETAKVLVYSGLSNQKLALDTFRDGVRLKREELEAGRSPAILSIPITKSDRGGLTLAVSGLRDHQYLYQELSLWVPWTDRELDVKYATFRDQIRPGSKESFRITVASKKGAPVGRGEAEVLAYMYDRSLDLFGAHLFQPVSMLYPTRYGAVSATKSLMMVYGHAQRGSFDYMLRPQPPVLDRLKFYANYGIGGPGRRGYGYGRGKMMRGAPMEFDEEAAADMADSSMVAPAARMQTKAAMPQSASLGARAESNFMEKESKREASKDGSLSGSQGAAADQGVQIRSEFSETAFFYPHLVTDENGALGFEFQVPDSVTAWNVYAHAITKDVRGGNVSRETKSVKEIMVRTYAPRFLREGDEAEIKVSVNNASQEKQSGSLTFDIENPATGKSVLKEFGIKPSEVNRTFEVDKQGTSTVSFQLKTPRSIGTYAFKVIAKTKKKGVTLSDGERRVFPVLPSRMHLAQSRFVTLKNKSEKIMAFDDLAKGDDPTLITEKMVVTVDAQLFYGVLRALPYLVKYPYECSEQTLNRFLSTGIVSSLFKKYPSIQKMAKEMSSRKERFERFDDADANRRMTLEESPWLEAAQGGANRDGKFDSDDLVNVLDSRIAEAEQKNALNKLRKMQLPSGAFPWFEGGPPNDYMTLYMLLGFGRALEFNVEVPKDMVVKAFSYVRGWLDRDLEIMMRHNCCQEFVTLINFAVSQYPDSSWTGGMFDDAYRKRLLDYSFGKWKQHSPLLKGYLALTLKRLKRDADAKLVWDSVMDSAKSNEEQGTFWAQEDRSWLWYNDTIETHAFSIRTLLELEPNNAKLDGLVQWLFLNKKLNHWKSTRATAESIYSLAHFLDKTATLGVKEEVKVELGTQTTSFVFEPDKYSGRKNQIVLTGDKVSPKQHSKIKVSKSTPGFAFASSVWHFSTDELPKEDRGDFFQISRRYFKRENNGKEWILKPLAEGEQIRVGDQIEVQISIRLKHAAEYVHLRDPRAAGLEPENVRSGYKYEFGISWFEEVRDSGTNFFFANLPVGEYNFRYRLRANMAGNFRIGPATIQSIYAPEFNAYSTGYKMKVTGAAKP